jgi:phytanoyl-CoA hydroxylase
MKLTNRAIITKGSITAANTTYYEQQGFLIARNLLSKEEIRQLMDETIAIFRGERGAVEGLIPVYSDQGDDEVLKKYTAIHFPHKISPFIFNILRHRKITRILSDLTSANVKCMQSMLFVKGPGKAGQSWHQDEYYIPTRDRSLTGAWIALDEADQENGCLWVIPGSHREGYIRRRMSYTGKEYADTDTCDIRPYTEKSDALPLPAKSGDVVFFHGYLLHRSLRNRSKNRFRRALVNHYMSAESMLPWDWDGRLPLKEDMRDIVMVAGNDPYQGKGTENLTKPYLRPEIVEIKKD